MNTDQSVHRIFFIITQGICGGAQIHVRDLSTHLNYLGYDVHVAVGVDGPLNDELESYGITIHRVPEHIIFS